MSYVPSFTVSDEIMSLVAEIAEIIGHLSATTEQMPMPLLRKKNRIKTIQSSLAIENNSLSIEQVTAILEGKRVLGPPNEIQEVRNAKVTMMPTVHLSSLLCSIVCCRH